MCCWARSMSAAASSESCCLTDCCSSRWLRASNILSWVRPCSACDVYTNTAQLHECPEAYFLLFFPHHLHWCSSQDLPQQVLTAAVTHKLTQHV